MHKKGVDSFFRSVQNICTGGSNKIILMNSEITFNFIVTIIGFEKTKLVKYIFFLKIFLTVSQILRCSRTDYSISILHFRVSLTTQKLLDVEH